MTYLAEHILWLACRILCIAAVAIPLAACTGIDNGFGIFGDRTAEEPATTEFAETDAQTAVGNAAPLPPGTEEIGRVYFSPIIGAPTEKIGALSQRLRSETGTLGIVIINAADPSRTHEIKGYFSAITDNGATVVVHVWDIILPSGQRVHRIQGQESIDGTSDDPWTSVPDATMAAIADKMIAEFAAWQAGQA